MFAVDRSQNEYYCNSEVPMLFKGENTVITDSSPGIIVLRLDFVEAIQHFAARQHTTDQKGGHP